MDSVEELREQLDKELEDFDADVEVMGSALWGRMTTLFKMRRELLMSMVMRMEEDNPSKVARMKGRFEEAEYFLTLSQSMKEGAAITRERLLELDVQDAQNKFEEQGGKI